MIINYTTFVFKMFFTNTVLVLVLVNSFCSVLTDNINVRGSIGRNRYRYNHPPTAESYEVNPDNQNAKTENSREEKSVKFDNQRQFQKVNNHQLKEVPVTVIYDTPIVTRGLNEAENNGTAIKGRRRKIKKRLPSVNNETNQPKAQSEDIQNTKKSKEVVVVTEPTVNKVPTPRTIVPKTFTKRPPEDNPVPKVPRRQRDPVVKIVDEQNYVFAHSGNFHYSYEGGDGTKISSQGELRSFKNDATGEAVVGSVFYKDNEGNDVSLSYTADENGYRPHGAHLPTPPPVPRAIARALAYLATKTTPAPVTEAIQNN